MIHNPEQTNASCGISTVACGKKCNSKHTLLVTVWIQMQMPSQSFLYAGVFFIVSIHTNFSVNEIPQ